jgi:hypothetical protein
MSQTDHPITPPPELVQQWINEENGVFAEHIATQAARWGADQELEACCQWLSRMVGTFSAAAHLEAQRRSDELRAARRPKPPSQAEQAIAELDEAVMRGDCITTTDAMPSLRAALKRLAELEAAQ